MAEWTEWEALIVSPEGVPGWWDFVASDVDDAWEYALEELVTPGERLVAVRLMQREGEEDVRSE